jgi:hypothetical protein
MPSAVATLLWVLNAGNHAGTINPVAVYSPRITTARDAISMDTLLHPNALFALVTETYAPRLTASPAAQ